MMPKVKRKVDWSNVEGARDCKRRLHLEKDEDGLYQCPLQHCDHEGFQTRRGCRKHVRSKHPWYSYFDAKPSKLVRKPAKFSNENSMAVTLFYSLSSCSCTLVGENFVKWLCGSTGGGKPRKHAQQTANRVLRYLRFCCADDDDELTEETIDFCLGSPALVCRFVDAMQDELKLGHSAQLGYLNAISELMDYRKVSGLSLQVISSFTTTEVYIKRARKTITKKMKLKWANDLDIESLEAKGCWASLEDLSKVIPYHLPRLNAVMERCKAEGQSVPPADLTFATRFLATYLFVKVKGSRPMTYQHLTLEMIDKAVSNGGFIDQKMFKTARIYSFDSLLLEQADLQLIEQYREHVRPLLKPKCDYLLVTRNGTQYSKLCDLLSKQVFEAIGKHIHPTRYRQIIETESASRLDVNEQQAITEDQKHSSRVAKLHYQKRRSREVATRGHACMQKLRGEHACEAGSSDLQGNSESGGSAFSTDDCDGDGDDGDGEGGDDCDSDGRHDEGYDGGDDGIDCSGDDRIVHDACGNESGTSHSDCRANDAYLGDDYNTVDHNAHAHAKDACDDNERNDHDHNNNINDTRQERTGNNHRNLDSSKVEYTDRDSNAHERRPNYYCSLSESFGKRHVDDRRAESTCRRKTVLRFTIDEDRQLRRGLAMHGFGRWKSILEDPRLRFQNGRTTDSIKKRAGSVSFREHTRRTSNGNGACDHFTYKKKS